MVLVVQPLFIYKCLHFVYISSSKVFNVNPASFCERLSFKSEKKNVLLQRLNLECPHSVKHRNSHIYFQDFPLWFWLYGSSKHHIFIFSNRQLRQHMPWLCKTSSTYWPFSTYCQKSTFVFSEHLLLYFYALFIHFNKVT